MRTIARRFQRAVADPGSVVSVIAGVFVGALLGGAYESRAHTIPARGSRPGARDD
jgi:hypothetical protein